MALIAYLISNYSLSLLACGIIFYVVRSWLRRKLEPPGPICLPILGYVPFFFTKRTAAQVFNDLAQTYGDVFQLSRGQQRMVILNSAEKVKEVFKRPDFTARSLTPVNLMFSEAGEDRFTFASGEIWRQSKRIAQHALGQFTSSRDSRLEINVHKCIEWLIAEWKAERGKPIVAKEKLTVCTASIISSLCFGGQPDPNDPFLHEIFNILGDVFVHIQSSLYLLDIFPSVEIFLTKQRSAVVGLWRKLIHHVMKTMKEYQPNEKNETIADTICKAAEQLNREDGKSRISMTDEEVRRICVDLYEGGFFTTTDALEWILLILACKPEIQKAVHAEIDRVIDKDQLVSFATERDQLPLTYACLIETFRFVTNGSVGMPHTTTEDVTYNGYVIRKGTSVFANLWACNHDSNRYENPLEYNPQRYLNKNGTFNRLLAEELLSFGYGRRRCPGETIAKQELFLIIVYLMQAFEVKLDPNSVEGDPLEAIDVGLGVLSSKPHKLIFEARD